MTAPKSWMTKKDVEYLMNYIDSEEPSYCVMQIISSHLPLNEKSTLGGQAMNLIDGLMIFEKGVALIKMTQDGFDSVAACNLFINSIFDLIEVKN